MVFISGEEGNKGQILRESRQHLGTGNIRKIDFWGTDEQAILFKGNKILDTL